MTEPTTPPAGPRPRSAGTGELSDYQRGYVDGFDAPVNVAARAAREAIRREVAALPKQWYSPGGRVRNQRAYVALDAVLAAIKAPDTPAGAAPERWCPTCRGTKNRPTRWCTDPWHRTGAAPESREEAP